MNCIFSTKFGCGDTLGIYLLIVSPIMPEILPYTRYRLIFTTENLAREMTVVTNACGFPWIKGAYEVGSPTPFLFKEDN